MERYNIIDKTPHGYSIATVELPKIDETSGFSVAGPLGWCLQQVFGDDTVVVVLSKSYAKELLFAMKDAGQVYANSDEAYDRLVGRVCGAVAAQLNEQLESTD